MLTITDGVSLSGALRMPLDVRLKQLLIERHDQLDGRIEGEARFIVMQPGDGLDALEAALGFSVLQNQTDGRRFGDPEFSPSWEWLAYHGFCFEMVFIFDDSGFSHVVLVENRPLVNRKLRLLCLTYSST